MRCALQIQGRAHRNCRVPSLLGVGTKDKTAMQTLKRYYIEAEGTFDKSRPSDVLFSLHALLKLGDWHSHCVFCIGTYEKRGRGRGKVPQPSCLKCWQVSRLVTRYGNAELDIWSQTAFLRIVIAGNLVP